MPIKHLRGLYAILFGMQTLGAMIFIFHGIPLFRRALAGDVPQQVEPKSLMYALTSITLMQVGYWLGHRWQPLPPRRSNPMLAHLVLFLAHMGFAVPTTVFVFVFVTPSPGFHMPMWRYAVTVMGLFALFCYSLEFHRLGAALSGARHDV